MTWVVNKNMPGYLPESEPTEVDTFEEALEAICQEVDRDLDAAHDGATTDEEKDVLATADDIFTRMIEAAREKDEIPTGISFHVYNLIYFAERTLNDPQA